MDFPIELLDSACFIEAAQVFKKNAEPPNQYQLALQ